MGQFPGGSASFWEGWDPAHPEPTPFPGRLPVVEEECQASLGGENLGTGTPAQGHWGSFQDTLC